MLPCRRRRSADFPRSLQERKNWSVSRYSYMTMETFIKSVDLEAKSSTDVGLALSADVSGRLHGSLDLLLQYTCGSYV